MQPCRRANIAIAGNLVYLLNFYNLDGWRRWGSFTSDVESLASDGDDAPVAPDASSGANSPSNEPCPQPQNLSFQSTSSQPPQTLEDAVEAHPELAMQELAEELGLDYDRIESTVQAYKTYRAEHAKDSGRLPSGHPHNQSSTEIHS